MSTAKYIADILIAKGYGSWVATSGWSINVGKEPDAPDTTITIYDTGGFSPAYNSCEYPTIQIRVRGKPYPVGYDRLREIRDYLINYEDANYQINLMGDILHLSTDERGRSIFVCNFQVYKGVI